MKTAMKNATKEGKSMDEALAEMQSSLQNAKTDTEAMQIAMDLFGTKAGPQLASAIQEGRLSFDDLSNTVLDWGDAVDKTFGEVQDDGDQLTAAQNEMKSALAEVGKVVAESVAPVLKDLSDILKKLSDKWK
jgi:phage-related minor tail protein